VRGTSTRLIEKNIVEGGVVVANWGTSYFNDFHGVKRRRQQCSIDGCEHLRQLLRRYSPDGTKYQYEHTVCCHHKVDGSLAKHAHQDKQRQNHWRQMGILLTTDEYNQILNLQGGKCAICGVHSSHMDQRLCVDHNHKTGCIRGLICKPCNALIAWFEKVSSFDKIETHLKTKVFEKYKDQMIQDKILQDERS